MANPEDSNSESDPPEEDPDEDDVLDMFGEDVGDTDGGKDSKDTSEDESKSHNDEGDNSPDEKATTESNHNTENKESNTNDSNKKKFFSDIENGIEPVDEESDTDLDEEEQKSLETIDESTSDTEFEGGIQLDVSDDVEASKAELDTPDEDLETDLEFTESIFSGAAEESDEEAIESLDDEEFERALTREEQSAEEILATLEESGALDPDSDSEIDLNSDDLTTDDYTAEYLESLFPLLNRSSDWVEHQYDTKAFWHPDTCPVTKDIYTWEHFKIQYYYTNYNWDTFTGEKPTAGEGRFADEDADEGTGIIEFNPDEYLGFDPEGINDVLHAASDNAGEIEDTYERKTVSVSEELDEDGFFSTQRGHTTVTNRYDLEKSVPSTKKSHFEEIDRYWVNKPFACVILYRSSKENEVKYYVVQPHLNPIEENVLDFLIQKLRNTIKYSGDDTVKASENDVGRAEVIERETYKLLDRYNIYERPERMKSESKSKGLVKKIKSAFNRDDATNAVNEAGGSSGVLSQIKGLFSDNGPDVDVAPGESVRRDYVYTPPQDQPDLEGISERPEPKLIEEDNKRLNEYQVQKIMYYLKRDFVGYAKIDPIKRDINVEDISCNGYNKPVFVYHTDHEQIITNIYHGDDDLDEFVVKLAQRSGKGISKRQPQVDCTLPDGSRAQLTLGQEVSDHGTNYTIRQFKDVPFTPVDLVNWNTFSLDEMAFLWLCIENHKSLIFAGGTASGKTTSLNAVSIFIPSNTKIVSIEDTREVELPQRNWIASVTRPSFSDDEKGDIDEFDLLEAALRQRPDYIVMGEIRGEEGRTLFQVMSTGHTTYTTFHADTVEEVMKRFTTDPINVSKTLFTALDLVSIQSSTRVNGHKVRRNQVLTEVNGYDPETDEINVQDVYEWQAETDSFIKQTGATILEEIKFDRGWNQEKLDRELFKRKAVLSYLIKNNLSTYVQVGATIQAFMTDPETTLGLIANEQLENSIEDLREMESLSIDVDAEKEALVPRPTPDADLVTEVDSVLDEAEERLFRGEQSDVADIDLSQFGGDNSGSTPSNVGEEPDTDQALDLLEQEEEAIKNSGEDSEDSSTQLTPTEDSDPFAEDESEGLTSMFGEDETPTETEDTPVEGGNSIFDSDSEDPFDDTDDLNTLFGTGDDDDIEDDLDDMDDDIFGSTESDEDEDEDSDLNDLF